MLASPLVSVHGEFSNASPGGHLMRKLFLLTVFLFPAFAAALHAQDQSETKRYLYLSTPDAAQAEGLPARD